MQPGNHENQKFIFCRPQGGLNDTLVQIYKCYRYAKRHKRTLVIDSRKSGIYLPLDRFFELHKPDPTVLLSVDDDLLKYFDTLPCHPQELRGRISTFKTYTTVDTTRQLDVKTGVPTGFDFKTIVGEPLVVHENFGGGNLSTKTLRLLCLKSEIAEKIKRSLSQLPKSYVALQVRNTDMQSNYLQFFQNVRPHVAGRFVLLSSDDDKMKACAAEVFGSDKVINLRRIGGFNGKPLHLLGKKVRETTKFKIVLDALTDLMAMAHSQTVYLANNKSGFGRLGRALQADKALTAQLLGNSAPASSKTIRSRLQAIEALFWRLR